MAMSTGEQFTSAPVYQQLRARILEGSEEPGSALTESAVSLRFSVARPTAKLAIERLVAEGLLLREAHRAARVPQFGRADIIDLYNSRAIIESAAIGALATGGTIPAEALAAHRSLLARVAAGAGYTSEDIAFHRFLVTGQTSTRLARIHGMLMGEIELCIGQLKSHHLRHGGDIADEHQGILNALVAGDADLASARTLDHTYKSRDRILARFDLDHPEGN